MDWKVEIVDWVDPHSVDPWESLENLRTDVAKIVSIGFVVKETEDALVLSLNWDAAEKNTSCAMIIPKQCITKRRTVNVNTRKKKRK